MKRILCTLLFPLFFLLVPILCTPFQLLAGNPVDITASKLVKRLASQATLTDTHIQLVHTNFTERSSGMVLPLSSRVVDALATKLVENGAVVSIHETGVEPLLLIGNYCRVGKKLELRIFLRKLAVNGSRDIASATETIALKKIDPTLLGQSLPSLARQLIQQLEKRYLETEESSFVVALPTPATSTAPTLKLGTALQKELQEALSESELFGVKRVVGSQKRQVTLAGTYDVITAGNTVNFTLRLLTGKQKQLAVVSGELSGSALPETLFTMVDDRKREVCVEYVPIDRRAVSVKSPTVTHLTATLHSLLSDVGLTTHTCTPEEANVRVSSSLTIRKKKMADGYGLLLGELSLQIYNNNNPVDLVSSRGRQSFTSNANLSRDRLVDRLFSQQLKDQLAEAVLALRSTN